jgi:dihydroxyacetone kinase-like predicted kinase
MIALANAGVVDAGGMGLVEILYAMARALGASVNDVLPHVLYSARARKGSAPAPAFKYEVQYLLRARDEEVRDLRRALGKIGDSVAVIGGRGRWRVHVHTDDRDAAIALGDRRGEVSDSEIVDLARQIPPKREIDLARADDIATLIAVAKSEGLRTLFEEMGAIVVEDGKALARAIADARGSHVVVLPNDPELLARALAGANGNPVTILPSRDAAQGLAAAAAYADARAASQTIEEMRATLARVRSGGATTIAELIEVARSFDPTRAEILTVLCARAVDDPEREETADRLRETFPHLQVEVHAAGQPGPRFLVWVE